MTRKPSALLFQRAALSGVIGVSINLVMACSSAESERVSESASGMTMTADGPAFDPCESDPDPNKRCPTQDDRYSCPATEAELLRQPQAEGSGPGGRFCSYPDGGNFDHRGRCYRQVPRAGQRGGNQCCYGANGKDNCTGSYDLVSVVTGVNTNGSCQVALLPPTNLIDHCNTDVRPFCEAHRLPGGGFGGPLPAPQPTNPAACTTPPPRPGTWSSPVCQCLYGDVAPPTAPPYVPPDICAGECTAGAQQCGTGGNISHAGPSTGSNPDGVYTCVSPSQPPYPGPARCNGWFEHVTDCRYGCSAGKCNPPPAQQPIPCFTNTDCPAGAACFRNTSAAGVCVYPDGSPATPESAHAQD